jgi:hypothetical protein
MKCSFNKINKLREDRGMFKKKIILALALTSMISSTFAAGANSDAYFDGFYGQVELGLGAQSNSNTWNYSSSNWNDSYQTQYGKINPQYGFSVGYSKKVFDFAGDNDINLAVNLTYNATAGDSGKNTSSYIYNDGTNTYTGGGTYSTKTNNIFALTLEPGYYLSKHGLGYLKVGWAQGQTTMTQNYGYTGGSYNQNYNFGTQSGVLLGFGFKHGLNAAHPNVFWGIEAYQINMRAKTIAADPSCATYGYTCSITSQPTLLFGKIHIGYMFN